MSLTGRQKKHLKKNIKNSSIDDISKDLGISENDIKNYLKKIWGEEKLKRFLAKRIPENNEELKIPLDLKRWIKKNRYALVILALLIIAAYANSLLNEFVSDDIYAIQNNERINNISYFWHFPLFNPRYLIIFITHKLFGANPMFYRIPNILFHLGSSLIIYAIASTMFKKTTALFAAGLFAVHPIQTEAVTWISGGAYSFGTFFSLVAILAYILSRKAKLYLCIAIGSSAIAILSSTQAIVLIPLIFLIEWLFGNLSKNWKQLLPFFLLTAILAIPYLEQAEKRAATLQTSFNQQPAETNLLTRIPIAVTTYIHLVAWPKNLTLYHTEMTFSQTNYIIRLMLFILLLIGIAYTYKKKRRVFFWLAFFLIALSPTLVPYGISWIVAERYVYMGAIGIYVTVAYITTKLVKDEKAIYTVFAILALTLLIRTVARNNDWQNQDTLWIATAKTSPSSPQNHNNLGDMYGRKGDYEKAVEEFQIAIQIKPNYADAYHNLANTYQQMAVQSYESGDGEGVSENLQKAVENYTLAIQYNPNLWQSYQNLGVIYFNSGQYDQAARYFEKAIEINSTNLSLRYNLGVIYLKGGDKELARGAFLSVLEMDPTNEAAIKALQELGQ